MVFLVFLGFFNVFALVAVWELWKGLGISGELWGALGDSGMLWEALGGSVRLWEDLGGSVSRGDTGEIHKGLIAYIPSTYLLKTQRKRPGDSYRTYFYIPF